MPDIAMCNNKECPLSLNCWRFNAPPSEYSQAYAMFDYNEEKGCEYYIDQTELLTK